MLNESTITHVYFLYCGLPSWSEVFNDGCLIVSDVILYALGTAWELHKPYFQKSGLLRRMVKEATEQSVFTDMTSDSDNDTPERQGDFQHF
jgi:hypothetical protein